MAMVLHSNLFNSESSTPYRNSIDNQFLHEESKEEPKLTPLFANGTTDNVKLIF